MRFYHDSGLAFSKATAGRKDHADPAPPPPSADLWVWRLHKGRLQWLFFGLSAHIIIVIVQWTFIFHFGACCFLALMCYIVNVKITTFSQGIRYIEMELLDGDLHTEIRKHRLGHLPPEMSGKFLKHITSGLMHLHSRRLIHRDIKPGNIFVSGSIAKIGDFGLTVEMGPNVTVAGTPNYLPYDIWNSVVPMTIRADLWGLGCVLQLIWR